jgi:uncharacterized protein (TIGR02996 family)
MANTAIGAQVTSAVTALGRFVPAMLFVLADNLQTPMDRVLDWERQLADAPDDATLREVYADWLRDHACKTREQQVRHEAAMIRVSNMPCPGWAHPHQVSINDRTRTVTGSGMFWATLSIQWEYTGLAPPPPAAAPS